MMRLSPDEAIGFARARGLVSSGRTTAVLLGGGVSNDTVLVVDGSRRVVVKRALAQLRTAVDWYAPPERALDEAAALRLAATLTPGRVPPVLAADPATATIALAAAPERWRDWKVSLLGGMVRPEVGAILGTTLGTWHRATHDRPGLVDGLDGMDRMEALRLRPFHGVVAGRHRDLAGRVDAAAEQLRDERLCFVHGDFSPKNVLAGESELWVIDFEVAHVGHPVFDLAFLQAHLLLKGVAASSSASTAAASPAAGASVLLREAGEAFLAAYRAALTGSALGADAVLAELPLHTGCLLLARADGTSLVDYLDGRGVERARALGRRLVAGELDVPEAWDEVVGADG